MYFNQEELNIYNLNKLAAGSDEAGRGCLAGPVFAASVILPNNFDCSIIDDSKKLTLHQRNLAYEQLIDKSIDYSIDSTDNFEIDKINILQSSVKSINSTLDNLKLKPDICFIDGNYFRSDNHKYQTIVKGDSKFACIAAASILAKVSRDNWMINIAAELYPQYHFDLHKGYATKLHFEMIDRFGICALHRLTFLRKYQERTNQLKIFTY